MLQNNFIILCFKSNACSYSYCLFMDRSILELQDNTPHPGHMSSSCKETRMDSELWSDPREGVVIEILQFVPIVNQVDSYEICFQLQKRLMIVLKTGVSYFWRSSRNCEVYVLLKMFFKGNEQNSTCLFFSLVFL